MHPLIIRCSQEQLLAALESKGRLFNDHHGFWERFCCEREMINLFLDLVKNITTDRVDAFIIDVLPHDILLEKLDRTGIDKKAILREKNFKRRQRKVKIGGKKDFGTCKYVIGSRDRLVTYYYYL